MATSGEIPFTATGEDQSISLPISLPGVEGTYPAYLEVFSNGQRIAVFLGDEDVVIAAPAPAPFSFGAVSVSFTSELVYTIAQMSVVVTNNNPTPLQGKIYAYWNWSTEPTTIKRYRRWDGGIDYYQLSLAPGESQTVISPFRFYDQWGDLLANGPYIGAGGHPVLWFEDEFGGSSPMAGPF